MSLTVATLRGVLQLDSKPFSEGVAEARGEMRGIEGETKRSAGGMRNSLMTVAGAVAAGFAVKKVVGFGSEMMSTSARVRTAGRQMDLVFEDTAGAVSDFAAEHARSFGLTESAMEGALAGFGGLQRQIGFTADEASNMATSAGEVAAALVNARPDLGDFEQVLGAISTSLLGNREQLKRWGIDINQADIDARLAADGLGELEGEARKQAEAQTILSQIMEQSSLSLADFRENGVDPSIEASNRLGAAVDDLKEKLAQALTPALTGIATVLATGLEHPAGQFAVALGGITTAAVIAAPVVRRLKEGAEALGLTWGRVGRVFRAGLVVAGVIALGRALHDLADKIDPVKEADLSQLTNELARVGAQSPELDNVADAFGRVTDPSIDDRLKDVSASVAKLGGILGDPASKGLRQARQDIEDFDAALADLASRGPEGVEMAQSIVAALIRSGVSADDAREQLTQYRAVLADLDTDEAVAATDDLAGSFASAEEAVKSYNETLQAQFDPLLAMIKAQQDVTEAQRAANEAIAEHGPHSEEAAAADLKLTEAMLGLDSAATDLNMQVREGNIDLDAARERLILMAGQMGLSGEEALRLADRLIPPIDRANELGDTDPTVRVTQTGVEPTMADLAKVIERANRTDATDPEIEVTVQDLASFSLSQIKSLADQIPRHIRIQATAERLRGKGVIPTAASHTGEIIPGPAGHEVGRILEAGEVVFARNDPVAIAARAQEAGQGPVPALGGGAGMAGAGRGGDTYHVTLQLPPGTDEGRLERYGRAFNRGFAPNVQAARIRVMSRTS